MRGSNTFDTDSKTGARYGTWLSPRKGSIVLENECHYLSFVGSISCPATVQLDFTD